MYVLGYGVDSCFPASVRQGWGLQEGMDVLPKLELQQLPLSPQLRSEQLRALNPPPFYSQHVVPLSFVHIGNIFQGRSNPLVLLHLIIIFHGQATYKFH